ncbi:MAG: EpsG family protein [Cetobacterium sp.]
MFLFWIILSFTLLWGLRYDVGIDYLSYENIFIQNIKYGEVGYKVIENITRSLGNEFYIVTLITSFLTIIPIAGYFYNSEYNMKTLKLGNIILYLSEFGSCTANLMRQGVAMSLFMLATQFYVNKKYKLFVIIILIGLLFHKSIILAVPLFILIDYIKISRMQGFILVVGTYIAKFFISYTDILLSLLKLINNLYPSYNYKRVLEYASTATTNRINIGILVYIFIFLLVIVQQKKINLNGKLYLFSILIRIFSTHNFIFNRIGFYFILFIVPFFMDYLKMEYINKKNKIKTIKIVIVLMIILFIKQGYFSSVESKNLYKNIIIEKINGNLD